MLNWLRFMKEKPQARRFFDATFGTWVPGMDLRWFDLRFQGECAALEQPFKRAYIENSIGHVRFACLLGFLLFAVFGILDAMLLPNHTEQIWIIRYGILCPTALIAFAVSYTKWFSQAMQPVIAGLVMFSGFCISAMVAIAPDPVNYSYYAGNILVIIFGYAFFRLLFVWATLAGWTVVFSYQVAALVFSDTPTAVLVNNNFFFLSANAIGMFASYSIEQYARRDFFMAHELTNERHALESYRDELESRVEERTRDALAAARSKSEFLANMSHEIRTPMNGVLGMLDLLRGTPLEREQQESVETAFKSAEGLLSIINEVLDLSKIEAGKMVLHPEPMAPGIIVEDVCALLNQQAKDKGLILLPLLDASVYAQYNLDCTRTRQILLNLVGNAIKFTDQGYVYVHCSYNGSELRFVVQDTGIGISPDQQLSLFEAFSQADGSTTRKYGGTGLGLTITRELVGLMQGSVELESELGQGTSFKITMPVHRTGEVDGVPSVGIAKVAVDIADAAITRAIVGMLRVLECEISSTDDADVIISDTPQPGRTARVLHFGTVSKADQEVLTLPLRLVQIANMLDSTAVTKTTPAAAVSDLAGLKVLLVEDNPVNRQVAGAMLKRSMIDWMSAENGQEALQSCADNEFDLILMDCQMPVMDGFEASRLLRERERKYALPATPIIALTANAMAGDRENCLAAGMDDYLAKPVNLAALQDRLRYWSSSTS